MAFRMVPMLLPGLAILAQHRLALLKSLADFARDFLSASSSLELQRVSPKASSVKTSVSRMQSRVPGFVAGR